MTKLIKASRGYSLIELLVVLVILGILITAGVWYSQSSVPSSVKSSTSSLAGALRSAQTLSLSSGQQVYLRTTGGGTDAPLLEWGFRVLNANGTLNSLGPVQGSWALTPSERRFVSVGVGTADLTAVSANPLPSAVAAISAHVVNNTTVWNQTFFAGGSTPTADASCPFFLSNGTINQEFFVTVTGVRSGVVFPVGNRMGLIIVSPRSGISLYSKQDPKSSTTFWNRM